MVYCVHDINGMCKKTNGECILDNPETLEDYKKCPKRKIAKHFNEMTREEKNIVVGIQNKRDIAELVEENKRMRIRINSIEAGHSAVVSRLYLLEDRRKKSIFVRMKKWLSWKK